MSPVRTFGGASGPSTSVITAAQVIWGPDFGTSNDLIEEERLSSQFQLIGQSLWEQEGVLRPSTYFATYPTVMREEGDFALQVGPQFPPIIEEGDLTLASNIALDSRSLIEESSFRLQQQVASYPMEEEGLLRHSSFDISYRLSEEEDMRAVLEQTYPTGLREEGDFGAFQQIPTYGLFEEGSLRPLSQTVTYPMEEESDVTRLEYTLVELRAAKDSWVNADLTALGACADTANHNSSYLTCIREALVTSNNSIPHIGFDLSGLPSNATITSAELVLQLATGSGEVAGINITGITSATETWAEATLVCSNRPTALGAPITTFTQSTIFGSDTVINITGQATVIQNRIGTTRTWTVMLSPISTGSTVHYVSKDFPAGSTAFGPRLRLRFTVPV